MNISVNILRLVSVGLFVKKSQRYTVIIHGTYNLVGIYCIKDKIK